MKQRYLFFLVILLAFGFIGCDTGTGTDTNGNGTGTDTYTITFNTNGGSSIQAKSGIASGSTITLPAEPTRSGYTFSGWYTDNNTFSNAFTASTPVTSTMTVYAKWTSGSSPANPFIGKWSCTAHDQGGDQFQEIEFYPDLTYLYVVDGVNNLKGTYSFTDAELTVIFTYSWDGDTWVKNDLNDPDSKDEGPYTIDGNSLTCLGNTYQLE